MDSDIFLKNLKRGKWSITREVRDTNGENLVAFSGYLHFYSEGDGYIFLEKGVLKTLRTEVESSRMYRYKKINDRCVAVLFEDGKPFYSYDLESYPLFKVNHLCEPDMYRGSIVFDVNAWTTDWSVKGPTKDFRILTKYNLL
ncbi:MAG: hypothetical protein KDD37_06215 [Bdellovibrionales bacterium]|nr:hypothetical protein [Bdellovibrionales bacterium]